MISLGTRMPESNNNNSLSSQKTRTLPKAIQCPVGKRSERRREGLQRRQGLHTLTFVSSSRFIAGQVALCFELWKNLTSDPYVLDIIQFGFKSDCVQHPLIKTLA